jgi:hypothetical protein
LVDQKDLKTSVYYQDIFFFQIEKEDIAIKEILERLHILGLG